MEDGCLSGFECSVVEEGEVSFGEEVLRDFEV